MKEVIFLLIWRLYE